MFKSISREIRFKAEDMHTGCDVSSDRITYINNLNRSWFKTKEYKVSKIPANRFGLRDLEYATREDSSSMAFEKILSHFFRCMEDITEMYDSTFEVTANDRPSLSRATAISVPKYGEVVVSHVITTKNDNWIQSRVRVSVCADPFERFTEVLTIESRSVGMYKHMVNVSSSIKVKKNK